LSLKPGHFTPACASLIELKTERAHDVTPAFDLVRIELGEFVARRRARLESERLDPTRKAGDFTICTSSRLSRSRTGCGVPDALWAVRAGCSVRSVL
jgi:hypothetical protein